MEEKHLERYAALLCHRQDIHAIQKPDGSTKCRASGMTWVANR